LLRCNVGRPTYAATHKRGNKEFDFPPGFARSQVIVRRRRRRLRAPSCRTASTASASREAGCVSEPGPDQRLQVELRHVLAALAVDRDPAVRSLRGLRRWRARGIVRLPCGHFGQATPQLRPGARSSRPRSEAGPSSTGRGIALGTGLWCCLKTAPRLPRAEMASGDYRGNPDNRNVRHSPGNMALRGCK
jgi:hypothetical protein